MEFILRNMKKEDTIPCLNLFNDTISHINIKDYTPIQIHAWINPDRSKEDWQQSFENRYAFVVCHSNIIVGFVDMDENGYLDRLYVHYQYQHCNIAKMLVSKVEEIAKEKGISEIETHASITAQPFFSHLGYQVIHRQTVNCRGVFMDNFVMKKKNHMIKAT